jgi:hypothetical protein
MADSPKPLVAAAALIALGSFTVASAEPGYRAPAASQLDASIEQSRALAATGRLTSLSEEFVGAPYVRSPLGEGDAGGSDTDPRVRYDAFDCTTFVETAMALSLVDDSAQVEPLLDVIRYRGAAPAFVNRRHFPAAEWIPELVELGFLDDITRQIAGEAVVAEATILNAEIWDRRRTKILDELPSERIPDGRFLLNVWPLADARAGYRRIPNGTVLSTMRTDRPRLPVRITHQGLVIVEDGRHLIRHAVAEPVGRVVDEPLGDYLDRIRGYREWYVVGVHLARVRAPEDLTRLLEQPRVD